MFSGGASPFKEIENEELIEFLANDGKPKFDDQVPDKM